MEHWFRWHHGTATDPKWRLVAMESGQPVHAVIAVWTMMLEAASQNTPRGSLAGWNDKVAAVALDMRPDAVAAIRGAMEGLVCEDGALSGWEKRQPKREDGGAERARRWREEKRGNDEEPNAGERKRTQANARGEEKREEEKGPPVVPLAGDGDPPVEEPSTSGKGRGRRVKTALPTDWSPKLPRHADIAAAEGRDLEREATKFRTSAVAKGYTYANWDAAFDNWLRSEFGRDTARAPGAQVELVSDDPGELARRRQAQQEAQRAADEAAQAAWKDALVQCWDRTPEEEQQRIRTAAEVEHERLRGSPGFERTVRWRCLELLGLQIGKPKPESRAA